MNAEVVKPSVFATEPNGKANGTESYEFLQSKDIDNKIKLSIKLLQFHNSKLLTEPTVLKVQLVEYTSDYVLRKISNPLVFTFDSRNQNEDLEVEIPICVNEIFSKDFKVFITMKNYLKKTNITVQTYKLLVNLSEGQVNMLCQGLRLLRFDDFGRSKMVDDQLIYKINQNLVKNDSDLIYLNKLLLRRLEHFEDFMSFDDLEKGCNFLLISFPSYGLPAVINDKLKVDNTNFYSNPALENVPQLQKIEEPKYTNNQLAEFIQIGENFNKLKFLDPLQYESIKNPMEEKKEMILRKKPYKNTSKKPINDLEPGYLTKLILERLVDETKFNFNGETNNNSANDDVQTANMFDDIIATTINKNDFAELNWLNIYTFQDLYQVLQENNKEHNSFRSKLIWEFRRYILTKLDVDGSGMLTILGNINWNDVLFLPKTFLLKKINDLNIFYLDLEPLFDGYDFKKVSVEILLQLFRFKMPLLQDSVFQDCIYYNEENTEEIRTCLYSKLQQFLHENFTIKIMKNLKLKDFQLYLLHIVEGVCWDYKNSEYFDIEFDDESLEEDEALEEEVVIEGNNFTVPKSITLYDPSVIEVLSPLAYFLLQKGLNTFVEIGNYLFWYLKVQLLYSNKIKDLIDSYESELSAEEKLILNLQRDFIVKIDRVNQTMKTYVSGSINNMSKQEYLEYLINTELNSFIKEQDKVSDFVRLPIVPNCKVIQINSKDCKIFKSSLQPVKLSFTLEELSTRKKVQYSVIYKNGDDLKQDQLISNIIKIMDFLLLEENVNLSIKSYDILPLGLNIGMIEFIESDTVSNILSKNGSIKSFLNEKENQIKSSKLDITNIFIKSTAAYSIITYLLGIGDRHLENLLITPKGEFFHADFGYILGNDPKLFPPLMKLPPQIVEGFGGTKDNNAKYDEFRGYCFVCFLILRRNSGLLIDLFKFVDLNSVPLVMRTANKGKISSQENVNSSNGLESNNSNGNNNVNIVKNDYNKFVDKFQLEMTEDDAILYLQNLINTSINALLPLVIDHLHNLAQYWRN